ncbi:MAG: response regulator transcription factor [Bacteroidetes bacterium]|nr:response regulator transcription factor [Bacteroidota bacterium]MBL7104395.1 response regulator transcription factor [Bacteroidales bacterium]
MEKPAHNIILADDHEIFLDSLSVMLNSEENLKVAGKVNNGKELVKKVQESVPDLCIVDMDMPNMNGLQASEILLKLYPDIKILILTMHKEKSLIRKMMSMGVKGYLIKTCDKDEFIFAINQVLKNKTHFSDEVIKTIVKDNDFNNPDSSYLSKIAMLSNREKEIIRHLCIGLKNKQISEKLYISPKTIDNHRTSIMRKLDVHNIVELIRFCLKHGLAE